MNIDQIKKEFKEIRDNLFGGSANLQQTQKLIVMIADLGKEVERLQRESGELSIDKDLEIEKWKKRALESEDMLAKIVHFIEYDEELQ